MDEVTTEALDLDRRLPCLILIAGSLGNGVLLPGTDYRVVEIREYWEPSPNKGGEPTVSTVIRFDPLAARSEAERLDELELATAIHEVQHYGPRTLTCMTKHRRAARKLAAEYVRLHSESPEQETSGS